MSYQLARHHFLTIRAHSISDPPPRDALLHLQLDLYRWQVKHFGLADPNEMALGMVEEIGELDDATTIELEKDAVADVLIYGCQLLTIHNLSFATAVEEAMLCHTEKFPPTSSLGRLAHVTLKGSQKIRGLANRASFRAASYKAIVSVFASMVDLHTENLEEVVIRIARDVVLKRTKGHKAIPQAANSLSPNK